MTRALVLIATCSLIAGCHRTPAPPRNEDVVVWKPVGSWSGRGNQQTETFTSDTGGFRVRWRTTHETKPGTGILKVVFRSGDSGRVIMEAVDASGTGEGVEEVADNVRWYYLTIESSNVDWTVSVDERLHATRTTSPR